MTPDEALFRWATDRVEHATAQRDAGMAQVAEAAGSEFASMAADFVCNYLACHESASGEELTDACLAAGIAPDSGETRAFGPVYFSLSKKGVIEKCGFTQRLKGHRCSGANLWKLASQ